MQKRRILVGIAFALLILIIVGLFYWTGGKQLITLYTKYLSQDIPDKQYSYQDFTDRGPRETLHGYYAGSVGNTIYLWTYSGLKRYRHQQWTSLYYYTDMCKAVREMAQDAPVIAERGEEYAPMRIVEPAMTYDIQEWLAWVQRGDYIWVLRVGEGDESKIIDKVWGNNNNYPYGGITLSQCTAT